MTAGIDHTSLKDCTLNWTVQGHAIDNGMPPSPFCTEPLLLHGRHFGALSHSFFLFFFFTRFFLLPLSRNIRCSICDGCDVFFPSLHHAEGVLLHLCKDLSPLFLTNHVFQFPILVHAGSAMVSVCHGDGFVHMRLTASFFFAIPFLVRLSSLPVFF